MSDRDTSYSPTTACNRSLLLIYQTEEKTNYLLQVQYMLIILHAVSGPLYCQSLESKINIHACHWFTIMIRITKHVMEKIREFFIFCQYTFIISFYQVTRTNKASFIFNEWENIHLLYFRCSSSLLTRHFLYLSHSAFAMQFIRIPFHFELHAFLNLTS